MLLEQERKTLDAWSRSLKFEFWLHSPGDNWLLTRSRNVHNKIFL